jgi:hypothetical protein
MRFLSFTFLLLSLVVSSYSQTATDIKIPLAKVIDASSLPDGYDARVMTIRQQPHPARGSEILKRQLNDERARKMASPALNKTASSNSSNSATTPQMVSGFQANPSNSVPNDNHMAISNGGKVVSVVNTNIRVYNEAGTQLYSKGLSAFSSAIGTYNSLSDPRIMYDPDADRFISLYFNGYFASNSTLILGFSKTNDPAGAWNFYKLPGNPFNDSSWSDYPIIALTKDEIFFTFNLLKDGVVDWKKATKQSIVWQVGKQEGFQGDSLNTRIWSGINYNNKPIFELCPAQGGSGLQGPGMYFVSVRPFDLRNDTVLLTYISNTIKSGSAQISTKVFVQDKIYGLPPNAPMGNGNYLQTNDARVLSAIIENNIIHYVQNSIDTLYNTAAVYYGKIINPQNSNPSLNGTLIRSDTMDYGFPSIAYVGNGLNDHSIMITCSHVSTKTRPGTSVFFADRNGFLSPQLRCKDGDGWVNALADTNERWGDYTGIQRKYNEPGVAWVSGSYGDPGNYLFRTWIAKVKSTDNTFGIRDKAKPAQVTASVYPNPVKNIVNVEFELQRKTPISADVYDLNGKLVAHVFDDACRAGLNRFSFNAEPLGFGLYMLRITTPEGDLVTKQFVVE